MYPIQRLNIRITSILEDIKSADIYIGKGGILVVRDYTANAPGEGLAA